MILGGPRTPPCTPCQRLIKSQFGELLICMCKIYFVFYFRTSLHCAAANNSVEMCKFLINHGACVFAVTAIEGKTPSRCCEKESENYEKCFTFLSGKTTAKFAFLKTDYQEIFQ